MHHLSSPVDHSNSLILNQTHTMLIRIAIIAQLVFSSIAFANIEQVRFFAPFSTSAPTSSDKWALSLPPDVGYLSLERPSELKTVKPKFPDSDDKRYMAEEYYLLTGLSKRSFYEFRVCWPAYVCFSSSYLISIDCN